MDTFTLGNRYRITDNGTDVGVYSLNKIEKPFLRKRKYHFLKVEGEGETLTIHEDEIGDGKRFQIIEVPYFWMSETARKKTLERRPDLNQSRGGGKRRRTTKRRKSRRRR